MSGFDVGIAGAQVPIGTVLDFAGSVLPDGFLWPDGRNVSRTTYAKLFTALSTAHGAGDGSTTFGLPDLRGRVVTGKDNLGGTAANRVTTAGSGVNGVTLGAAGGDQNMQSHLHTIPYGANGSVNTAGSSVGIISGFGNTSTTTVGAGASGNVQPTIVLNKIIYAGV